MFNETFFYYGDLWNGKIASCDDLTLNQIYFANLLLIYLTRQKMIYRKFLFPVWCIFSLKKKKKHMLLYFCPPTLGFSEQCLSMTFSLHLWNFMNPANEICINDLRCLKQRQIQVSIQGIVIKDYLLSHFPFCFQTASEFQ